MRSPVGGAEPLPYAPQDTLSLGPAFSTARPGFFPHPRQGTRALPYKIAWCRAAPLITDAGRRGRRPLRTPIGKHSVGADAHIGPPYRTPCKTPCHCEASAHTGCGERAERCQWQEKRGERVAAVKISSVRRKAAQKFWAPQQGHPPPPSSRPPCLNGAGTAKP